MAKQKKEAIPALFGIRHSNRDFSSAESWSKNKFNSSFPASLIGYMNSRKLSCVYLTLESENKVVKNEISAHALFGDDPLSDDLYYSFESAYTPFQSYCIGAPPSVDLMLMNRRNDKIHAGYEIKLTTLPDETTSHLSEREYGCELVVRMPSIQFIACSIASIYGDNHAAMKQYFGRNGFGNTASYVEAAQVNPVLGEIWQIMNRLVHDNLSNQRPAVIQPVWKTMGKTPKLADHCLDVFVWSDLAFTQLFMSEAVKVPADRTHSISRPTRALIQLFFMLNEVCIRGKFHADDILQKLTYTMKNDKAFSVAGKKTRRFMSSPQLEKPRVHKSEIKKIILGNGQLLLSPERRFDAVLVNSPELFD